MILTVEGQYPNQGGRDYHCKNENGEKLIVDLVTDGSFEGNIEKGDKFHVLGVAPFIYIASDIKKVEKNER